LVAAVSRDFAPLLRRVIFVGNATIGERFDFEGICLSVIGLGDDLVEPKAKPREGPVGPWG
jgi:hypothetical protein